MVKQSEKLKGWFATSDPDCGYSTGLTDELCHSGTRCAFLKSIVKSPSGIGCISQQLNAEPYREKRLRFSAFVKSKDLRGAANIWLGGFAEDHTTVGRYHTSIDGNEDWAECEVFLEVSSHAVVITFGLSLDGKGTLWIDDAQLEVVDAACSTTPIISEQYQNQQVKNLSFTEEIYEFVDDNENVWTSVPTGWTVKGSCPQKQSIKLNAQTKGKRGRVACITSTAPDSSKFELIQFLKTDQFADKQVRFSAELKSSKIGWASLWTTTYTGDGKLNRQNLSDVTNQRIQGTIDWTLHECPIPIASDSTLLSLAIVCVGSGRLWIRNVRIDVEPYDPEQDELLDRKDEQLLSQIPSPLNLDFRELSADGEETSNSKFPKDWIGYEREYKITACSDIDDAGAPTVLIETLVETPGQYSSATLSQNLEPEIYLGKRLRFSANVKSSEVDWAAVWLRARRKGHYVYTVGFKNLHSAPITGSTDWNRHDCVVDVPKDCIYIAYGIVVHGPGKVW
ncbi:MAG: hypothetical protein K2X93_26070, partial [Candidatus Obscuribacterales bacterium]|nr:hypothetical protein [Candidatus Obscuribacterales bacterium]